MMKNLTFSHKILLAASLVVFAALALFTLYNDSLQRNAIRADLKSYLQEMGEVTASNTQNWLSERIHQSTREIAGTARQLHDVSQLVVNASGASHHASDACPAQASPGHPGLT